MASATEGYQSSEKGAKEYYSSLLICGRVTKTLGMRWMEEGVGGGPFYYVFLDSQKSCKDSMKSS